MWILTATVNAYDQYGEYFLGAFSTKPTVDQLKEKYDEGVAIALVEKGVWKETAYGGPYEVHYLHEVTDGRIHELEY